jgi:hypothetical protein
MINTYIWDNHGIITAEAEFIIILEGKFFGPFPKEREYIERIFKALQEPPE